MWLMLLWYLLYCGGLEINLQCLWGLPIVNLEFIAYMHEITFYLQKVYYIVYEPCK